MSQISKALGNEQFDTYYEKVKEKSNREASDSKPLSDDVEDDVYQASREAQKYNGIDKRERTAKVHRHELINRLIEGLEEPLEKEQKSKNAFRFVILVGFSIFFLGITIATFVLLFKFSANGFTEYSEKVSNVLISGLFVNIAGLAVIIFKYLFDDKNSLLKDMIQLVANTLKNSDDIHKEIK